MSMEGVVHCDGPDCEHHQRVGPTTTKMRRLPPGWSRFIEYGDSGDLLINEFCCCDCAMKSLAKVPPPEVIDAGDIFEGDQ